MTPLDRLLRNWRMRIALPQIPRHGRVLDIGCGDARLLDLLDHSIAHGVAIDPALTPTPPTPHRTSLRGTFPADVPASLEPFDALVGLAVLEHIPDTELDAFASACARWLKPGGRLVLTVPAPSVDRILEVLRWLHLVKGMALEQHHGFNPARVSPLFAAHGFDTVLHRRFQLGLNNLFVLLRTPP